MLNILVILNLLFLISVKLNLVEYYPALIGLSGVVLGGLISYLTGYSLKKEEAKARIIEKIFDKRIQAHEEISEIVQKLRTTLSLNRTDEYGNALTYPAILHSLDYFENFQETYYYSFNRNMRWLDIELVRELNYLQDYFENLKSIFLKEQADNYPNIALKLKTDLINCAQKLDKAIGKFYENDIYSINVKRSRGHHKLPKEETRRRLTASQLYKYLNNE